MPTKTATKAADAPTSDGFQGIVEGFHANETAALAAIRRFVDTVNDTIPDLGDPGPRARIIDAAFAMTGSVVEASNKAAADIVGAAENMISDLSGSKVG